MKATQESITVIRDEDGKVESILVKEGKCLVWKKTKDAKEAEIAGIINGEGE